MHDEPFQIRKSVGVVYRKQVSWISEFDLVFPAEAIQVA